jgi:hypothetical protein
LEARHEGEDRGVLGGGGGPARDAGHPGAPFVRRGVRSQQAADLKGIVTKIEWSNPHTYFYIDVAGADGKVVNWGMEMGSPNGLMRAGWTRNTMHVGDEVAVEGAQAKDGAKVGNARVVTMVATGKRLFAASSQTDTPQR